MKWTIQKYSEAVVQRWSVRKMVSKSSQNSPEPLDVLYKKGVFKNFAKFPGKDLSSSLFLIKLQVFLWILQNFLEYLFRRTPLVAASEYRMFI